ncbi:uncharacterized protein LOC124282258 [Haliotis rubra]|uniref:uncharacterized protein LOC124282258 n=1 Tax=Haliotis rubra TaxID=36100 RepID=UPI001EE4EC90|nr:uncharacterized protein LOC124282258 [Haliotis rubra]
MAGKQYSGGPQPPSSPSLGRGSIPPSPDGPTQGKDISPTETPRKNKRKLSEPRKRTDFSIKRFCPDSPGSAMSDSGCSEDFEGVQENPPQTPDPTFLQDHDDSSLGRVDTPTAGVHFLPGVRANCIVPNLYINKTITASPLIPGFSNYAMGTLPEPYPNGFTREQMELLTGTGGVHDLSSRSEEDPDEKGGKKQRKNYKNMTRERRVEANARERSRVHTISAAFDALRKAVPSYSYNQKLSKLAILRIACSYILALTRLADVEYCRDVGDMSFSDCVDMCTQTIQTEGRARRRH